MEILAPAGSKAAFYAALNQQADAVYLSGKQFGARAYADNFTLEELADLLRYAHLRQKKVHITVNTLLSDEELPAALEWVCQLYQIGADAIIIQDWGLFSVLRQQHPEICCHASTQMTFHNSLGCQKAESLGFQRVILARETSLAEMKQIQAACSIELEVFVHGALCICYSGQCLFSSLVGGRSGNRGRCAQPCRFAYQLQNQENPRCGSGHLLSPKDLNCYDYLTEIAASGMASAKIEGRMKRPEYVAAVTGAYVSANQEGIFSAGKQLEQAFNREFTTGYLLANPGKDLMSYQRPNNRGTKLGRIVAVKQHGVQIKLEAPLQTGDGVEIWVSKGGRQGFTVESMQCQGQMCQAAVAKETVEIPLRAGQWQPQHVKVGDRVFKTSDVQLNQTAQASFSPKDDLPVRMHLIAQIGQPLQLHLTYQKIEIMVTSDFVVPKAEKHAATWETVQKQLARLGGTSFYLAELTVDLSADAMLPASVLNGIRRQALAQLEEKLLKPYQRKNLVCQLPALPKEREKKTTPKLAVLVDSAAAALAAFAGGADLIEWNAWRWQGQAAEPKETITKLFAAGVPVQMVLPVIAKEAELPYWQIQLRQYQDWGVQGLVLGHLWGLQLAEKMDWQGALAGDLALNTWNSYAVDFWRQQGLERVALSLELDFPKIQKLKKSGLALESQVFGNLQMMISEHCVPGAVCGGRTAAVSCSHPCQKQQHWQLKDEKGFVFLLAMDQFCRLHVYNGHILCLLEDLTKLQAAGVAVFRLDCSFLQPQQVQQITAIFRQACQKSRQGLAMDWSKEKTKLQQIIKRPFTKGHYYRGVE